MIPIGPTRARDREATLGTPSELAAVPSQKESDEMTSPPPMVPSARQVIALIEFLMNRTLPSPNNVLTPPG